MARDAQAWKRLGNAIRADRERQGITRDELAARSLARGVSLTGRSIYTLEAGVAPKRRDKPPSLEPAVAALGWPRGAADRILDGEDPEAVLRPTAPQGAVVTSGKVAARPTREGVLALLPQVYAFSRAASALGASVHLRDEFDELAQHLIESIPVEIEQAGYELAAYAPHREGEGVATDDELRILRALDSDVPSD